MSQYHVQCSACPRHHCCLSTMCNVVLAPAIIAVSCLPPPLFPSQYRAPRSVSYLSTTALASLVPHTAQQYVTQYAYTA
eukprot:1606335-Rhodomonas_salina.4